MNKIERAIRACNEAADALSDTPINKILLFSPPIGDMIKNLRNEADYLENISKLWEESQKEIEENNEREESETAKKDGIEIGTGSS